MHVYYSQSKPYLCRFQNTRSPILKCCSHNHQSALLLTQIPIYSWIPNRNILQKESDVLCLATPCTVSESDFLLTASRPEWSSGKSDQDSAQRLLCSLPGWESCVVLEFHFESWSKSCCSGWCFLIVIQVLFTWRSPQKSTGRKSRPREGVRLAWRRSSRSCGTKSCSPTLQGIAWYQWWCRWKCFSLTSAISTWGGHIDRPGT